MVWIAAGFAACFVAAFWLSARVGLARQSSLQGLLAGLLSFALVIGAYLVLLAFWARAQLVAFLKTELPLILERVAQVFDQVKTLKETL
jgi:hypothetical protein